MLVACRHSLFRHGVPKQASPCVLRYLTTSVCRHAKRFDPASVERAEDEVDVCIVGAGPAGLSAAIRLKQLERERGNDIRVVVLEKGSEAGSHILSGAVVEPRALNELLPDWKTSYPEHPFIQPALKDSMLYFTESRAIPIPHPPQMSNKGNYIVSLSAFTRWLAGIAEEEYSVELYPGFAGSELYYEDGKVRGVITNEVGLSRKYEIKSSFEPGMLFKSRVTLLAEGAHGSLSKQVIRKYDLRRDTEPQTYAIGLKEVWRVPDSVYRPGSVMHGLGWPLTTDLYGGSFLYHMADSMVSLGLVVGLDYKNPYFSPYHELQRMKHHPYFRAILTASGATRLAYGGRALNEGGLQSVPSSLHFPGGALLGCSAGFVNISKIKGVHNAMKSGMLAAETAFTELEKGSEWVDMSGYSEAFRSSWLYRDLYEVRNIRPAFSKFGMYAGALYAGVDGVLRGRVPWTLRHGHNDEGDKYAKSVDSLATESASSHKPIEYPPFEPPLSTDLMTSVSLTGTNHEEDEPVHLKDCNSTAAARREHVKVNVGTYAGLLARACPAGVYEYVETENASDETWERKKLVINAQNCIHCKLCDIKVPTQDITWSTPQGGGGPKYSEHVLNSVPSLLLSTVL
ncbi:hypothetical protein FISHEDRAFT_33898 [Fistulina hepatica ATCC 64428]|uniref:Electron transfer flavoprotein-ubiquinone oxidoreductase n=1 Tax=Fistulina hepatica ATCC 64428 TaxID=1128425 RepID=A0A0D7AMQ6_9AGAR|nr:hypothetical protein FISHEDRAFT_33898 [Fistulina hepatica ATCC 64428]